MPNIHKKSTHTVQGWLPTLLKANSTAEKWTKNLGQVWPGTGGATCLGSPCACPELLSGHHGALLTQHHWASPGLRSHAMEKGFTSKVQNGTSPERQWRTATEIAATDGSMVRADTGICLKRLQDTPSPTTAHLSYQSRRRVCFGADSLQSGFLTLSGFSKWWTSAWHSWKVFPECKKMGAPKGRAARVSNLPGSTAELW